MLHLHTHVIPCSGFVRLGSTTCTNTQYQPAKHGGDAMLGRSSWSGYPNRRVLSFLRPRLGFLLEWWEWPLSKSQNSRQHPSTVSMIAFSKHVETGTNRTGKTNVTEAEEVSFVLPVVTSWSITPQPQLPHMSAACSTKSAYTSLSSLHGQIQWNFNWGERSQPCARHSAWRCAGITWTALGCFGISTLRFQNRRTCAIEQRRTAMKNYEQNQQHGQRPMRSLHLCVSLAVLPLTLDAWLESFMLSARTIQAS